MAVDPSRELAFVANQGSVSVSIVDYRKGIVLDEVPVGERPSAILLHQNGRFLAVAETGADAIRYLHANTLATLSVQQVPDRPYGLSFTPDYQYLLVTHLLNGTVSILPTLPYTKFLPILAVGSTETRLQQDPGSSAVNASKRPARTGMGRGTGRPAGQSLRQSPGRCPNRRCAGGQLLETNHPRQRQSHPCPRCGHINFRLSAAPGERRGPGNGRTALPPPFRRFDAAEGMAGARHHHGRGKQEATLYTAMGHLCAVARESLTNRAGN